MHPNQMSLQNQQMLANQGLVYGQGLAGLGQYHPLGSGGGGGGDGGFGAGMQAASIGPRYVSTMEMMENDVADWLLDWDK